MTQRSQPGCVHPGCYFTVPKQRAALCGLGKRCGACKPSLSTRAERASRFRQPRRSLLCGLCPAAVCDLRAASRPTGGRGLRFLPQCLSGELGCETDTGDSFVLLEPRLREGALQTERQTPPPTCLRAAASFGRQDGSFQDTCHMLGGPRKEKFP